MSAGVQVKNDPVEDDPRAAEYAFWIGALRGEAPELTVGRAESGFYRNRAREGGMIPIAIWRDSDGKVWVKNGRGAGKIVEDEEAFCERVFSWCCKNPVSEDAYQHFMIENRWPDDAPPPAIEKSNLPEDPFEALKVELQSELEELEAALKQPVTDSEAASRFGNWRIRFAEAWARGEEMRKVEKKPHDDGAKAVQAKFLPVLTLADRGKNLIDDALRKFMNAEKERQRQERQKIADAARAAGVENPEELMAPEKKVVVETVGRKVVQTTTYKAVIDDYPKALEALRDHPTVVEAVQSVANASARSKARLPIAGVRYVESSSIRQ
jgi:hypothetical protein